jgi:hypothetical protein
MAVTDIRELRILPPFGIGRMGPSAEPMENYDVVLDPADLAGVRRLAPAPTLQVDDASGRITQAITPGAVSFRDGQKRIKPVAPFLEVWAQFSDGGSLEPLTKQHVDDLRATVEWRAHTANLKAFRRTGDVNDQIHADTNWFSDHAAKPLRGQCANFKTGKSIPLGSVRFIDPTAAFPEIRLRFTPPAGLVYGPTAGDPNIVDDVYDASHGRWFGHFDGDSSAPPPTSPGQIYYGRLQGQGPGRRYVSLGYLDDASDGIVEVRATFAGQMKTAFARISAGPPTFAPDSYHVRTVADELNQIAFGPVVGGMAALADAQDVVRRGLETVRLMNTAAMNGNPELRVSNMAGHDSGWGRAREPIFPAGMSDAKIIRGIHESVLRGMTGGDLSFIVDIQRQPDKVADLSDAGRRKMPAMMRGSDSFHLALTRRQVDTIRAATTASPVVAATPEQNMHKLIDAFFNRRMRHLVIPLGDGRTLADLFSDKSALLNYLRTAVAKGDRAGAAKGKPLVVPGKPEQSAFVQILRDPAHPMHQPFTEAPVADTGKSGLQIVEEWITSLT